LRISSRLVPNWPAVPFESAPVGEKGTEGREVAALEPYDAPERLPDTLSAGVVLISVPFTTLAR
jgi:hypothetical protein